MMSRELFYRFILSRRAGSLVRTISRISIIGIWLGVFALVLVMSVMNGFNRSIQNRLLKLEPHLVVTFDKQLSIKDIKEEPIYSFVQKNKEMSEELFIEQDVILRTEEGKVHGAVAKGVTQKALERIVNYAEELAGRNPETISGFLDELKPNDVIMGLSLAETTGLFEGNEVVVIPPEILLLPTGEVPTFSKARLKGFILTEHEKIDKSTFYYLLDKSFPRLLNTAGIVRGLEIRLTDPSRTDYWKGELREMGLKVVSWKDRNASLFFALKVEKIVIAVLVGLSTLIAALSIISVMVLLLAQKRRDIGNFLAMGLTMNKTKSLFISIGMYLALIGVVLGILTGVLASLTVDQYSQDVLPRFYQDQSIPAEIHWYQVLLILLIATSFTFLTLSWTMRKISQITPSQALRS